MAMKETLKKISLSAAIGLASLSAAAQSVDAGSFRASDYSPPVAIAGASHRHADSSAKKAESAAPRSATGETEKSEQNNAIAH